MKQSQIRKRIDAALANVNHDVSGHASRGGLYAHGLASEGYNGGYACALRDVLLLMQNCTPHTNHWWEEIELKE